MRFRIFTVLLLVAGLARAEDLRPTLRGFEFGLGADYAVPLGESATGTRLESLTSGTVPIQLDVGYRSSARMLEGLYFSYAPGLAPSGCGECSAWDIHFGAEVALHSYRVARLDPWVGLFFGGELLHSSETLAGASLDATSRGIEAGLRLGVAARFARNFTVGPVLGAGFGEFLSVSGPLGDQDVADKALHGWFTFGLHGTFDLIDDVQNGQTLLNPVENPVDR